MMLVKMNMGAVHENQSASYGSFNEHRLKIKIHHRTEIGRLILKVYYHFQTL